jgi:CelD/BcsL family acetyltransferase involved in cellulose biosynthesis
VSTFAHAGWPEPAEWSALAEASTNVFLTPEWAQTWWEHYGNGHEPVTLGESDDGGRLRSLLVGYTSDRGPLRILRLVGRGPADELGPACAPELRATAATALASSLRGFDVCDLFLGEQLRADIDWPHALGGRAIDGIPSPCVRLDYASWDDYLASRSPKHRYHVRKNERRAAAAGATFRLANDPERLDSDLDAFLELHRRQHGPDSAFASPAAARFLRAFAHVALERDWLRLWLLERDGRLLAAWYGFRFGGCDAHYQSARSRSETDAVGSALIAHVLRSALADGMHEYRFLRGGEEYKYRWANQDAPLATVAVGTTRPGRVAAALAALAGDPGSGSAVARGTGRVVRRALVAAE